MTMSQMTSFVKALKAAANGKVPETMEVVRPRNAHAPTGKGLKTKPVMVERKMASSCHACMDTAAGFGTENLTRMPTATDRAKNRGFAPCHGFLGVGAVGDVSAAAAPAADAETCLVERRPGFFKVQSSENRLPFVVKRDADDDKLS